MEKDLFDKLNEASIDWRRFEGTELTLCCPIHPTFKTLKHLIPEFEKLTGIKLHLEEEPESRWSEIVESNLSSGKKVYDIIACAPLFAWKWAPAGLLEALDKYLNDPSLTDKSWYNLEDFSKAVMRICRWSGKPGDPEGEGSIWMIPYMMEASIFTYREDVFKNLNLSPPDTWDDLLEAIEDIRTKWAVEAKRHPLILRGARFLVAIGAYPSILAGYGARDLDEKLNPLYSRNEFVRASEIYVNVMRRGCPPFDLFSKVSWTDVRDLMAEGDFAMTIDCDFFAYTWENPKLSKVHGKLAYAPVPRGPAGRGSKIWAWSLTIPSSSKNKEAAWLFIEWATSKPILLSTAVKYGNLTPPRRSVLDDQAFREVVEKWGDGTWIEAVKKTYSKYSIGSFFTPLPEQMELINLLSDALWSSLKGDMKVEEACKEAERKAVKLLEKASMERRPKPAPESN